MKNKLFNNKNKEDPAERFDKRLRAAAEFDIEQNGDCNLRQLIRNGIKHLAEIADLIKASCDFSVKEIGKSRKSKHKYCPYDIVFYSVIKKEICKDRNHNYSCKGEPVWNGIPIFEQIFKHFIFLQIR